MVLFYPRRAVACTLDGPPGHDAGPCRAGKLARRHGRARRSDAQNRPARAGRRAGNATPRRRDTGQPVTAVLVRHELSGHALGGHCARTYRVPSVRSRSGRSLGSAGALTCSTRAITAHISFAAASSISPRRTCNGANIACGELRRSSWPSSWQCCANCPTHRGTPRAIAKVPNSLPRNIAAGTRSLLADWSGCTAGQSRRFAAHGGLENAMFKHGTLRARPTTRAFHARFARATAPDRPGVGRSLAAQPGPLSHLPCRDRGPMR